MTFNILSIPLMSAECERIFSAMRKNSYLVDVIDSMITL
jgi:hypothetical protein